MSVSSVSTSDHFATTGQTSRASLGFGVLTLFMLARWVAKVASTKAFLVPHAPPELDDLREVATLSTSSSSHLAQWTTSWQQRQSPRLLPTSLQSWIRSRVFRSVRNRFLYLYTTSVFLHASPLTLLEPLAHIHPAALPLTPSLRFLLACAASTQSWRFMQVFCDIL